MVQSNRDRVGKHGNIDLWSDGRLRWTAADATGKRVGTVYITESTDSYAQALALIGLRRPFKLDPALEIVGARECWDDTDPWGSAMQVLGELHDSTGADAIHHEDGNTANLARAYVSGVVTAREIARAIRIMHRYLDLPEVAARSY